MTFNRARVLAVDTENRIITAKYTNSDRRVEGAYVMTDFGSYSFPKIGDIVGILEKEEECYCIGKLERNYKDQLELGKVKDDATGEDILAKNVPAGGIYLANLVKQVWLSLSTSGDFSLMNGFNEGIKYFKQSRLLKLAGHALQIFGQGARSNLGSAMRNIPSQGTVAIPSLDNPLVPAVEYFVDLLVTSLRLARFHIGEIINSQGAPEFGSWGTRLRAILEVCTASVPIAVLKMDEAGNIELSSTAATVMLNGLNIQLGGLGAASSVIKGPEYQQLETTFLNALTSFCTTLGALSPGIVPGDPSPGAPINGAAIASIIAAATTLNAAVSTYSNARSGTLSTITKTI